jgi:hypothetical protein
LERKLELFKNYYNAARVHQGLSGDTPGEKAGSLTPQAAGLENYRWQSHCHGLFELPIAARMPIRHLQGAGAGIRTKTPGTGAGNHKGWALGAAGG